MRILIANDIIPQGQSPKYANDTTGAYEFTPEGKALIEQILLGSILAEDAIRQLESMPRVKEKLLATIIPISQNSTLGSYSLKNELSQAIDLVFQSRRKNKDGVRIFASLNYFLNQYDLTSTTANQTQSKAVILLAQELDNPQIKDKTTGVSKLFSIFANYNMIALPASQGNIDMFLGRVQTPEEILELVINNEYRNDNKGRVSGGAEVSDVARSNTQSGRQEQRTTDGRGETNTEPRSSDNQSVQHGTGEQQQIADTPTEQSTSEQSIGQSELFNPQLADAQRANTTLPNVKDKQWTNNKFKSITAQRFYQLLGNLAKTGLAKDVVLDVNEMKRVYNNAVRNSLQKQASGKTHVTEAMRESVINEGVPLFQAETEKIPTDLQFFATKIGQIYGFTDPTTKIVYIDPDRMNANTPIHEFGHLWLHTIKDLNPELYKKGIDLAKQDTKTINKLQQIDAYSQKGKENWSDKRYEEYLLDEVLARHIGDKGEVIFNNDFSLFLKFRHWLYQLFDAIQKAFGIPIKENIDKMTLEQFVNKAYQELMSKQNLEQKYREQRNETNEKLNAQIREAEKDTDINPTEQQKKAGNYKMGHITIQGLDISIEQPKGSVRRGVDENGRTWETKMNNTYGYFGNTESKDGDHIDVFIGDTPLSQNVFVIDQINPKTRAFDEHKVMLGFNTIDDARKAYLSNYEKGWQGLQNITAINIDDFKIWAKKDGARVKPFAEYKFVKESSTNNINSNKNKLTIEVVSGNRVSENTDSNGTTGGNTSHNYTSPAVIAKQMEKFLNETDEGKKIINEAASNTQKIKDQIKKVSNFITDVLDGKVQDDKMLIELPVQINELAEKALGHPIKSHRISANEIRHINNYHGENGTKNNENSIPLRKEDIALLPYIMAAPDRVEKSKDKNSIKYYKTLSNGDVVVVEREIGKAESGNMENITMWADKKSHSTNTAVAQNRTPHATSVTNISSNDVAKIRNDFETAIEKEQNQQIKFMATDRLGNEIGDGSYHIEPSIFDFSKEFPQIRTNINYSETTESTYVKYTNDENGKSITLRFSNHENNAVRFGDQLNGFLATADEVLFHLGLRTRKFIPKTYLSISTRQVSKKDLASGKYEFADKTIKELYAMGKGADISKYKGKIAKDSNNLILSDVVNEYEEQRRNAFGEPVTIGKYIYNPLQFQVEIDDNGKARVSYVKSVYGKVVAANQADYNFDVSGITADNAAEMQIIKDAAVKDGTFMKAPNGEKTNLNERQWLQVRTDNFKQWFGDWEKAAKANFILSDNFVSTLTGNEFQKDNTPLTKKVTAFYKEKYNGKVERKGFGEVLLNNQGVRASIAHGLSSNKAAAFAAVPNIITKGVILDEQTNWKDRQYNSAVIAAPVQIGNESYTGIVVVTRSNESNRFYLHEVVLQKSLLNGEFKTRQARNPSGDDAKLQKIIESTIEAQNNSSKVVDANGEPMVVYHGSYDYGFTEFDKKKRGTSTNAKSAKQGFFFFTDKGQAKEFSRRSASGGIYEAFLNIKSPETKDFNGKNVDADKELTAMLRNDNDGIIAKNIKDGFETGTQIAVKDSSQIKSATDNNGDFIEDSPDIRFQVEIDDNGKAHVSYVESAEGQQVAANQADYDFDVSGITADNAAEMQRIKDEAVKDGTFMKAPNGEKTNLNERQWLQVRTDNFKKWFGDWEKAAKANFILSNDYVSTLTGNEFQKDNTPLTEKVTAFYKEKYNGKVERKGFGIVDLDKKGVANSLSHGIGSKKAAAFAAVPDIITKGVILDEQTNWKGRGYNSVVIAAPVQIGNDGYTGIVIVKMKNDNSNQFYLHEVVLQKNLQNGLLSKTGTLPNSRTIVEGLPVDNQSKDDAKLQKIIESTIEAQNNSSKVVL
ncbi:MAG: hypothetical protein LBR17_07790 [Bacteroidales bacterium]|jgi:hypothetical protein|nr:hypothetical protein [Bacteroidales bacterium]